MPDITSKSQDFVRPFANIETMLQGKWTVWNLNRFANLNRWSRHDLILDLYKRAIAIPDLQVKRGLETYETLNSDGAFQLMPGYLSLQPLGIGQNHEVSLAITQKHGLVAMSLPLNCNPYSSSDFISLGIAYYMSLARKPNIIQVIEMHPNGRCDFERAKGDLVTLFDRTTQIENVPRLIDGVLQGGVQMAQAKIMHKDLKPENLLLGMDGQIKYSDFEFAAFVNEKGLVEELSFEGNMEHFSPERFAHFGQDNRNAALHNVGFQDNVWGEMLLICYLAKKSTSPKCQLSEEFKRRVEDYQSKMRVNFSNRKSLLDFFKKMDVLFQEYQGNLFKDLTPNTPLDDLVKKMAAIDPKERIEIQHAASFFRTQL